MSHPLLDLWQRAVSDAAIAIACEHDADDVAERTHAADRLRQGLGPAYRADLLSAWARCEAAYQMAKHVGDVVTATRTHQEREAADGALRRRAVLHDDVVAQLGRVRRRAS